MAKPLVSFVIPVLNSEDYIARCLRSIRNATFPEATCEVLILDNGSTDRTPQIIHDLGFDFHVIPKVHVSALRNRGAMMAQGDYLAFVDADVELMPYWLQNALVPFQDRRVVASGCFAGVPQDATWVQRTWDVHQRGHQLERTPKPVPWLPAMNLIVRRGDFLAVAGFNERLETVEDVDLCYRLGQRGTILCNPAMEAIHWGEARNLRTFWRKEVWRAKSNLKGVWSHGLRWDEVPSLGYPLYVICCGLFFVLGVGTDLWSQQLFLTPLSLVLLILPALLLALHTAYVAKQLPLIPKLFVLYFVYGCARAYSIVKT
jgi:glycosyltransferase involved in cell wall biosynthesis